MAFNPEKSSGETGHLFEWEQIGEIDTKNPKYQEALLEAIKSEQKAGMTNGYIRFRKALDLAKKFQPHNPTNPFQKPFGNEILIALRKLLDLKTEEEENRLKFYTAVGSPLDKRHGVDGIIEYEDENGEIFRATFDLTANPAKMAYKSDIVVQSDDLPDFKKNRDEYAEVVKKYAEKVLPKMVVKKLHEEKKILFPQK